MITRENFKDAVLSLSNKDKKRVLASNKEYSILELHCFNVGSWASIKLTDSTPRTMRNGEAVVYTQEIQDILK